MIRRSSAGCFLLFLFSIVRPIRAWSDDFPLHRSWKEIVEINLIKEIGSENIYDEERYFSQITDLRLDSKGNVYLLDGREFVIKVFDTQGKRLRQINLHKGQGPGEFIWPKCLAVTDKQIFVGDMMLQRITVLDGQGNPIRSFKVNIQPAELEVRNAKILVTGIMDLSAERVQEYDLESTNKTGSFGASDENTEEVAKFGEKDSIAVGKDNIYFSRFFPYEVFVYSWDKILKEKFSRLSSEFERKPGRDPVTHTLAYEIGTMSICVNQHFIMNILKGRSIQKNSMYTVIDLFDHGGRWITSVPSSELGEPYFRVADLNDQYFVIDGTQPFPKARIFSITKK